MTNSHPSKPGTIVAGMYLLVSSAFIFPLVRDGYAGHGNGIEFMLAIAATAPLNVALLLLNDLLTDIDAFHMTGWPYYLTLAELIVSAIVNALLLYVVVSKITRKFGSPL